MSTRMLLSRATSAARVAAMAPPRRALATAPVRCFASPAGNPTAPRAAAGAVPPASSSASAAAEGPRTAAFTGPATRPMQYEPPPPELVAALQKRLAAESASPRGLPGGPAAALQKQARKNAILGLTIGATVIALWLYSVYIVEEVKETFTSEDTAEIQAELELEDRKKAAAAANAASK